MENCDWDLGIPIPLEDLWRKLSCRAKQAFETIYVSMQYSGIREYVAFLFLSLFSDPFCLLFVDASEYAACLFGENIQYYTSSPICSYPETDTYIAWHRYSQAMCAITFIRFALKSTIIIDLLMLILTLGAKLLFVFRRF